MTTNRMDADEFNAKLRRWLDCVDRRAEGLFLKTVLATKGSIVDGSLLTGAPGQPVQTANLKNSWQIHTEGPWAAWIATNVIYAPNIEEALSPQGARLTLRSQVGGFHSVKLTRANFQRLAFAAAEEVIAEEVANL